MTLKLVEHHFATRGKELPPVDESLLLDYVLASNGTFVRGRRPGLEVCMPVAFHNVRGLAPLVPYIQWDYPKVPVTMLELLLSVSETIAKNQPREALFHFTFDAVEHGTPAPSGHILCEGGWHLEFPEQKATEDRVELVRRGAGTSEERALIEVHSHHHERAFFSPKDDADEGTMSFRAYGVIGTIFEKPTIRMRIGLFGHFYEFPASEVFQVPENLYEAVAEKRAFGFERRSEEDEKTEVGSGARFYHQALKVARNVFPGLRKALR